MREMIYYDEMFSLCHSNRNVFQELMFIYGICRLIEYVAIDFMLDI